MSSKLSRDILFQPTRYNAEFFLEYNEELQAFCCDLQNDIQIFQGTDLKLKYIAVKVWFNFTESLWLMNYESFCFIATCDRMERQRRMLLWICCYGQWCYSWTKSHDFHKRLTFDSIWCEWHLSSDKILYSDFGIGCTDLRIAEADLGLGFVSVT